MGLRHPGLLMVFSEVCLKGIVGGFCVYSTKPPRVIQQTTKIESPAERIQVPEAPDLAILVAMGVSGAMPAASWCLRCPISGLWALYLEDVWGT